MRIAFRTAAHKAKLHDAPTPITYVITVNVPDLPNEARPSRIKRIFESALGTHVSEATLSNNGVQLVLHVPAQKMKAVYTQLNRLLPDAIINDVHPRSFDFHHIRMAS